MTAGHLTCSTRPVHSRNRLVIFLNRKPIQIFLNRNSLV